MPTKWLERLTEEDLLFVKRFLMCSGSLKELARTYGVSYPTVRLRIDRLIARIEVYDSQTIESEFERTLRLARCAEGKIDGDLLVELLAVHRKELEGGSNGLRIEN